MLDRILFSRSSGKRKYRILGFMGRISEQTLVAISSTPASSLPASAAALGMVNIKAEQAPLKGFVADLVFGLSVRMHFLPHYSATETL